MPDARGPVYGIFNGLVGGDNTPAFRLIETLMASCTRFPVKGANESMVVRFYGEFNAPTG